MDAISITHSQTEFQYRLVGLDSAWYKSDQSTVQYTNLDPGEYTFEFQSRSPQAWWSPTLTKRFLIAKPYWETWWFRSLAFSTLLGLIYFIVWYRTLQVKEAEQLKSATALQLSRLELRALKAQLNPHFIFNSISSVQYYLAKNKPIEAESYLQRFSQLMRALLENSEAVNVTLAEELQLMDTYVSLESERFFDNQIHFDCRAEGVQTENVLIPPALFQPYVENSIWHGLQSKQGQKHITVTIAHVANDLCIDIEDNGIGRAAAKEASTERKGHRSFGMTIASRRIQILNQSETEVVKLQDLYDNQGNAIGTRVSLSIPFKEKPSKFSPKTR